jgi:putative component of membrane protein insertase Oxa1/YidC/SpoIIIJ protein YidD
MKRKKLSQVPQASLLIPIFAHVLQNIFEGYKILFQISQVVPLICKFFPSPANYTPKSLKLPLIFGFDFSARERK